MLLLFYTLQNCQQKRLLAGNALEYMAGATGERFFPFGNGWVPFLLVCYTNVDRIWGAGKPSFPFLYYAKAVG
jgi:hypothetical protein